MKDICRNRLFQTLLLFGLAAGLSNCAALAESFSAIGTAFKGNTKSNRQEYNIREKNRYKKYLREKEINESEQLTEILDRLEQTDSGKGRKSKNRRHRSTKSIYTKKKKKKDQNILQKLLKADKLFPSSQ